MATATAVGIGGRRTMRVGFFVAMAIGRRRAVAIGRFLAMAVAAFAFKQGQGNPQWEELARRAKALTPHFGLTFGRFVEEFKVMNEHTDEALLI